MSLRDTQTRMRVASRWSAGGLAGVLEPPWTLLVCHWPRSLQPPASKTPARPPALHREAHFYEVVAPPLWGIPEAQRHPWQAANPLYFILMAVRRRATVLRISPTSSTHRSSLSTHHCFSRTTTTPPGTRFSAVGDCGSHTRRNRRAASGVRASAAHERYRSGFHAAPL